MLKETIIPSFSKYSIDFLQVCLKYEKNSFPWPISVKKHLPGSSFITFIAASSLVLTFRAYKRKKYLERKTRHQLCILS